MKGNTEDLTKVILAGLQQGQYNEPPEGEQDINPSSLGYLSELYLISLDRVRKSKSSIV